jgi:hypothetical protein
MDSQSAKKLRAKPMKLLGYPRSLLPVAACRLLLCRPPSRPSHRLPCPPSSLLQRLAHACPDSGSKSSACAAARTRGKETGTDLEKQSLLAHGASWKPGATENGGVSSNTKERGMEEARSKAHVARSWVEVRFWMGQGTLSGRTPGSREVTAAGHLPVKGPGRPKLVR